MRQMWIVGLGLFLTLGAVADAAARIKLLTLPVRERVEIRLNDAGQTLVEEERIVPLVKGENQVDFAWTNTRIEPKSIVFRVLGEQAGKVNVLSVSYPPGESALVWSVYSPSAGSARIRISYLLVGLERKFSYRAVASRDEKRLTLSQYLQVNNGANESFGDSGIWFAENERIERPIGIAESREIRVNRWADLPVVKTYTAHLAKHGWLDAKEKKLRVAMHYVIENEAGAADGGLGKSVLAKGKARIFQKDGHGGTIFLGEDWGKRTPPGDEMPLFLGVARDVSVKRTVEANLRKPVQGQLFHQHVTLKYEIENFKEQPVTLNLIEAIDHVRRDFGGRRSSLPEWELGDGTTFPGGVDLEKTSNKELLVRATLPAGKDGKPGRVVHKLELIFRNEW